MRTKLRQLLQQLIYVLPFLLLVTGYIFAIYNSGALMVWLETFFTSYGYITIALAAFIEAIILINFGLPGGATVLVGASLSGPGRPLSLILVILIGTIAASLGYVIDYYIGRSGRKLPSLSLDWLDQLLEKIGWRSILPIACIHPNFGSLVCLSLGLSKKPALQVLTIAVISQLFWTTFWGILASTFGMDLMWKIIKSPLLVVGLFVLYFSGRFLVQKLIAAPKP